MSIRATVYWEINREAGGRLRSWYYSIWVGKISPIILKSRRRFDTEALAEKAAERAILRIYKET